MTITLLSYFASAWNIDPNSLHLLRQAQNAVYEGQANNKKIILRITPSTHRNLPQLITEIAWMNALLTKSFPCGQAIPFSDDEWVCVKHKNNETFYAVCFNKIEGIFFDYKDKTMWNTKIHEQLGEMLGRLHLLTDMFASSYPVIRYRWDQEEVFVNLINYKSLIPKAIYNAIKDHIHLLQGWPQTSANFGLIHNDFRIANWIYHKSKILLIDFDQGCWHWKVNDFAHLIFATYIHPRIALPGQTLNDVIHFCRAILQGFNKFSSFHQEELHLIPDLIRLRIMLAYLFEATVPDSGDLSGSYMQTHEAKLLLEKMIIDGHPIMQLDFANL